MVGGANSCDIKLANSAIFPQRARTVKQVDQFLIYRHSSRHCTFVDSQRVHQVAETTLKDGSLISKDRTDLLLNEVGGGNEARLGIVATEDS